MVAGDAANTPLSQFSTQTPRKNTFACWRKEFNLGISDFPLALCNPPPLQTPPSLPLFPSSVLQASPNLTLGLLYYIMRLPTSAAVPLPFPV